MKKKVLCILLVFAMWLPGCSAKDEKVLTEEKYISTAQAYIESGEYDKAIAIMEMGINETGSKALESMLSMAKSLKEGKPNSNEEDGAEIGQLDKNEGSASNEPAEVWMIGYAGNWYFEGKTHTDQIPLVVSMDGKKAELNLVSEGTGGRRATISKTIDTSEWKTQTPIVQYSNDGYGNSGKIVFDFSKEDRIILSVTEVKMDPNAIWAFQEGEYQLVRNGVSSSQYQVVPQDMQYNINIFLSNFVEQSFHYRRTDVFKADEATAEEMAEYIYTYTFINHQDWFGMEESFYTLTVSKIDQQAERFFGRRISSQELMNAGLDIRDGKMYVPASGGASWHDIAVAETIKANSNGSFSVRFIVFTAKGSYAELAGGIADHSIYSFSAAKAKSDSQLKQSGYGEAVIRPYNYNGWNTYQLVEYRLEG